MRFFKDLPKEKQKLGMVLKSCNFTKRLQHRCFSGNISKF